MWCLIQDHIRRNVWVYQLEVFVFTIMAGVGVLVTVAGWDTRHYLDAYYCRLAGILALFVGPILLAWELSDGTYDTMRTLPIGRRNIAAFVWIAAVIAPVAIAFLAAVPTLALTSFTRADAGALTALLVNRLTLPLFVAATYCLFLAAVPLSRRLSRLALGVFSALAGFYFVLGPLIVFEGLKYLFPPAETIYRWPVLVTILSVTAAYPALISILGEGSGVLVWMDRSGPARTHTPRTFPPRTISVAAPWIVRTGVAILLALAALASLIFLRGIPEDHWSQFIPLGLLFAIGYCGFECANVVVDVRVWQTLPLAKAQLAALMLSRPLIFFGSAGITGFGSAAAIGCRDLPPGLFELLCGLMGASAFCEPMILSRGTSELDGFTIFAFLALLSTILVIPAITPPIAITGAIILIGASYWWLLRLLGRDIPRVQDME